MELAATYAYKIFQHGSFSKAAKALFISQPSLSATIARLENELGFKIFYRDTTPLTLTPEGRIYIETLEEILESENVMKMRLQSLAKDSGGTLSIGPANFGSYVVLSKTMKAFCREYPNIQITVDLGSSARGDGIGQKLRRHELDMMLAYSYDPKIFDATPICTEQLVFAVHDSFEGLEAIASYALPWEKIASASYTESEKLEDCSAIRKLPFLRFDTSTVTGKSMLDIMGTHQTAPHVIKNFKDVAFHYIAMQAGVAPLLVSDIVVSQFKTEDVLYFVPKTPSSQRTMYACVKKGEERNRVAEAFLKSLKQICRTSFPTSKK